MASLNIMKMKKGMLRGLKVHLDDEARLTHGHSNKHINTELTRDNFCINCRTFSEGLSKIENCIKKVDEAIPPKRIRADRVTTVAIEFKIPEEISKQNRDKEFAQKCIDYLTHRLGVPGMIGFGHVDEKHTYIDPLSHEERESLNHVHAYCPCYTSEHGINAKHFFGRNNLNYAELNHEFDEFVFQEFGIRYMTQNETLGLDVESLKKLSEATERHDNELKAELNIHQSLIDSGTAPELEVRESKVSDTVKVTKEDFALIQNDMRYINALKQKEEEKQRLIDSLKQENEQLADTNRQLSLELDNERAHKQSVIQLWDKDIEAHNVALKLLCEQDGLDYDSVTKGISDIYNNPDNSRRLRLALNPELSNSEKLTKKITHYIR